MRVLWSLISHKSKTPRYRTSQYRMTFISLSVSIWNDHGDPVFDGVGLAGFKTISSASLLTLAASSLLSLSLLSLYELVFWATGLQNDRISIILSLP